MSENDCLSSADGQNLGIKLNRSLCHMYPSDNRSTNSNTLVFKWLMFFTNSSASSLASPGRTNKQYSTKSSSLTVSSALSIGLRVERERNKTNVLNTECTLDQFQMANKTCRIAHKHTRTHHYKHSARTHANDRCENIDNSVKV